VSLVVDAAEHLIVPFVTNARNRRDRSNSVDAGICPPHEIDLHVRRYVEFIVILRVKNIIPSDLCDQVGLGRLLE
jgi:hypothetical protein